VITYEIRMLRCCCVSVVVPVPCEKATGMVTIISTSAAARAGNGLGEVVGMLFSQG